MVNGLTPRIKIVKSTMHPAKRIITCVKGKVTKKVNAVRPVCPSGDQKKWPFNSNRLINRLNYMNRGEQPRTLEIRFMMNYVVVIEEISREFRFSTSNESLRASTPPKARVRLSDSFESLCESN